jgi:hypothetical protein
LVSAKNAKNPSISVALQFALRTFRDVSKRNDSATRRVKLGNIWGICSVDVLAAKPPMTFVSKTCYASAVSAASGLPRAATLRHGDENSGCRVRLSFNDATVDNDPPDQRGRRAGDEAATECWRRRKDAGREVQAYGTNKTGTVIADVVEGAHHG